MARPTVAAPDRSADAAVVPRATRELEERLETIFVAHVITAPFYSPEDLRRHIKYTERTGNANILVDFAAETYFVNPLSLAIMHIELTDAIRKAK